MSPPGRPKGEYRRAPHEGTPVSMDITQEARRQQQLLAALHGPAAAPPLPALQGDAARGLAAYRAHAGAAAERALASAFPTIAALVGEAAFATLARGFWRARPPVRGDLGDYGAELPAFIADQPDLAGEPYLADSARLDWAVHQALRAADEPVEVQELQRLGQHAPAQLRLRLRAGSVLLRSRWPVVAIHQAHESHAPDRFAPVRAALDQGRADMAFVWRQGWRVRVGALTEPDARFTQALLASTPLAAALDVAGPGFDFESWLITRLQDGALAAVELAAGDTA